MATQRPVPSGDDETAPPPDPSIPPPAHLGHATKEFGFAVYTQLAEAQKDIGRLLAGHDHVARRLDESSHRVEKKIDNLKNKSARESTA